MVDDDCRPLPPGEVGELLIAGPCVMRGYWGDPAATEAVLRDGWLHTGDLAVTSERGYYKIVDRKKDMIISGGLNVYPAEVERVLSAHPAVVEVAVVGMPDELRGEVLEAFVVVREGVSASDELTGELQDLVKKKFAAHAYPRKVHYVEALPKTPSGKVQRYLLRQR